MSGLGIALGGFASGFQNGYGLGQKFREDRKKQKNQADLDQINTDAKTEFDKEVKAGSADANGFDQFWTQYALPRMRMKLLQQGNYEQAAQLQKWGESDATLRGGKLFGSAMLKAQLGDVDGALRDGIAAAKTKGYLAHGWKNLTFDRLMDSDGNLLGYRLQGTDPDGNEVVRNVKPNDVKGLLATFANPEQAWKTQQETRAAEAKRKEGLEDYESKKKIDRQYDKNTAGDDYRKAFDTRMKSDLDFADKSAEEKDAIVRQDLASQKAYAASADSADDAPDAGAGPDASAASGLGAGQPAAGKKVVVDQGTGQIVDPSQAPGLSQQPAQPAAPQAGPAPQTQPGQPANVQRPASAPPAPSPQNTRAAFMNEAVSAIQNGADPQTVARKLETVGISWPEFQQTFWQRAENAPAAGLAQ
jgi:hypothetical protein